MQFKVKNQFPVLMLFDVLLCYSLSVHFCMYAEMNVLNKINCLQILRILKLFLKKKTCRECVLTENDGFKLLCAGILLGRY